MRVYNFGAGPAALPEEVIRNAQQELLEWQDTGMSVLEISHRSSQVKDLFAQVEGKFCSLLSIPENYQLTFHMAPARAQFAMIPMNLLANAQQKADYLVTGIWSKMAADEAKKYAQVNIAASSEDNNHTSLPERNDWQLQADAGYLYYTPNETVNGIAFNTIPEVGDVPLVADMTSYLMAEPFDISRFGLMYAGAQKNIAPAGLTIVIVREDLINNIQAITPKVFDYALLDEQNSLYYTPNVFAVYMAGLMCDWLERQGGLAAIAEVNHRKANKLYDYIDQEDFYRNQIKPSDRSFINVVFQLADDKLNDEFIAQAKSTANLVSLKGHRFVGGMRASIYNAMPEEGVDALIDFMRQFVKQHG